MATASMKKPSSAIPMVWQRPALSDMREVVAFCPKCKTLEMLLFEDGYLVRTRKFSQNIDGHVYHDCGSEQPCRLYRAF
ncbi:MAG: hypothetical protein HY530_03855 [Chloroflexi bacterium]|nr:hypothetical protein [Chloroflexota bacterium]